MLIKQGSEECFINKHLRISWYIINICNNKCSYCFNKSSNNNSNIFPNKKDIDIAIQNILDMNYNTYEFVILGGEPLLYPYLEYLIEKLLKIKNIIKITIVSNGSIKSKVQSINNLKCDRIKFSFSIHPEYITDNIFENILNTKDCYMSLMFLPKFKKELCEYLEILKSTSYIYQLMLLRKAPDFLNLIQYSDDDIKMFYENLHNSYIDKGYLNSKWIFNDKIIKDINHGILLIERDKLLKFKDMYCLENSTSMSINNKGYYRGVICSQSKWSKKSIFINESINFNINMLKCKYDYCNCMGNKHVMKFKNKIDAMELINKWKT